MNDVVIEPQRPDAPEATQLILELEAVLDPLYPPTSRHGFSIDKLLREDVPFFVVRHQGTAAGCGGIKFFDAARDEAAYGELKRMYVRPQFRGLGLGTRLLEHLADYAQGHGVHVLRLETGIHQTAAIRMYERWGFVQISPFGAYKVDPLSLFYERRLD